ncbi:hypothetical protein C7C45_13660 [Micromonospora arborensis]|uniref:Uncharacterized protein n=1 Tax=Micromonospora arborensis TaxID=2116518 RepID=A0A318NJD0_9ACTN|nr:hypothetical protein [Micromonospora arborensis]PYC70421.1 hypothetical protein C7C45_13660 [Micromonospora arborensis]
MTVGGGVAVPPVNADAAAGTATPRSEQEPGLSVVGASQQASPGAVVAGFGLIAVGAAAGWMIWRSGASAAKIQPEDTTGVFLTLLVFAAAVERIVEPFSRWLPGRAAEAALSRMTDEHSRVDAPTEADREAIAVAEAKVARAKANRTIVAWGLASGMATVASSAGGFYVLHAVAGGDWNGVAVWVDAVVTGVMVGSGTKPLHDLITRAQNGPPSP